MSSQRKIDSARANGAKSRGPKTEDGRKASCLNAVKHGLYSATVVLSTESTGEYQQMLDMYIEQFQPEGPAEFDLIEQMVAAKWRQRRLWAIEADLFEDKMVDARERLSQTYEKVSDVTVLANAYSRLAQSTLTLLTRHEARLERAYSRSLKNLLELQQLRANASESSQQKMQERTQSHIQTLPELAPASTFLLPQTRNEKPETRNEHPETRNEKPGTRNERPETRNGHQPPT